MAAQRRWRLAVWKIGAWREQQLQGRAALARWWLALVGEATGMAAGLQAVVEGGALATTMVFLVAHWHALAGRGTGRGRGMCCAGGRGVDGERG